MKDLYSQIAEDIDELVEVKTRLQRLLIRWEKATGMTLEQAEEIQRVKKEAEAMK